MNMINSPIYIIIPCYNEIENVKITAHRLMLFARRNTDLNIKIIFIDDGSNDGTFWALQSLKKNYPQCIRTKCFYGNVGKGFAVNEGLKYAYKLNKSCPTTALLLDCDLSVSPVNDLRGAFKLIDTERPALVMGQRVQLVPQPAHRRFFGWCFRKLVNWLFWWDIEDTQCPFKLIHRYQYPLIKLSTHGFAFDVELIKNCKRRNYQIKGISVQYRNQANSKVTFRKTLEMFKDIMKIKIKN